MMTMLYDHDSGRYIPCHVIGSEVFTGPHAPHYLTASPGEVPSPAPPKVLQREIDDWARGLLAGLS